MLFPQPPVGKTQGTQTLTDLIRVVALEVLVGGWPTPPVEGDLGLHIVDPMPHIFQDGGTDYKYGFSVVDGVLMFNYEELV